MKSKIYLNVQGLLDDLFKLVVQVYDLGFELMFIIVVWCGGVFIGIVVQEYLVFYGIEIDNIVIRILFYQGIDDQVKEVKVYGLNYLVKNIQYQDRLFIVDDVFDSGCFVQVIINKLIDLC